MPLTRSSQGFLVRLSVIYLGTLFFMSHLLPAQVETTSPNAWEVKTKNDDGNEADNDTVITKQTINEIIISGNEYIPADAIRAKIPFRIGQLFRPNRSSEAIRSIYSLGYFKPNIKIIVEELSADSVNLHISVEEKNVLEELSFVGNKNLKMDELDKKIHYTDLKGIDDSDLDRIERAMQELYVTKDLHNVSINREITTTDHRSHVTFRIDEGSKTTVKRVFFKGNCNVPSKKLRSMIFTREDWLFGFLSKAGSYQPEAIEVDKYILEHYYKSNGFFHAKVTDVTVEPHPTCPSEITLTFHISEGDIYRFGNISAAPNDLADEDEIIARINIRPGDIYSSERLRQANEMLRLLWGEYGHIFAENYPAIIPHEDTKTVDVSFTSDLGVPIQCNRITITGNKKTSGEVIRREINIYEGDLLTTRAMDTAKERVERLGYFDPREGTNWKTTRIDEQFADLEMVVKEVKTGKFGADFKLGGNPTDIQSPAEAWQIGAYLRDINFLGTGLRYNGSAYISRQDRQIALNVVDPWLFGKPLQGGFDVFHRTATYTEFRNVDPIPRESRTGGAVSLGFTTPRFGELACLFDLGFETINFNEGAGKVTAQSGLKKDINATALENRLNRIFQSGNLLWIGSQCVQDYRNNPVTPTRGYLWTSSLKVGIPVQSDGFGFVKWDADAHWYTPLINEFDLIFHLHGHMGIVNEIGGFTIPYRELYHIGGPASVRGFLFGQIGPTINGDSLGGKKAMWMNAELIFPLTKDFNLIGLVFYDGGAGWDTPNLDSYNVNIDEQIINPVLNNQFNFRQAVGVGLKMRSPTPISVAVGLKLDRNKRTGEPVAEVHFSSSVDF